jgi:hypothetical protein
MSKFQKKRGKANPAISTASLPDIIFMLAVLLYGGNRTDGMQS